jgi:archaellum component FlaC
MIAEEVGRVLPEIVDYEENGVDAVGMDYSKLTPLLVEAVKALKTDLDQQLAKKDGEIAAQQLQIQVMQGELKELRTTVDRLLVLK